MRESGRCIAGPQIVQVFVSTLAMGGHKTAAHDPCSWTLCRPPLADLAPRRQTSGRRYSALLFAETLGRTELGLLDIAIVIAIHNRKALRLLLFDFGQGDCAVPVHIEPARRTFAS